ncbi:MAG: methylated-DNA--[protein]-cysteine S-methyltransferase [Bacteroidales bacterium]
MTSEFIIIKTFKSPFGDLLLGSYNKMLCLCDWKYRKMRDSVDNRIKKNLKSDYKEGNSDITEETIRQLNEYFSGTRKSFNLPLLLSGSEFQEKVWNELIKIPYGKAMSYLDLTKKTGDEKAIRAVASANGANAISIIVPCHRIIGTDGSLVGYAGGLNTKKKLLQLEGYYPVNQQLSLFD